MLCRGGLQVHARGTERRQPIAYIAHPRRSQAQRETREAVHRRPNPWLRSFRWTESCCEYVCTLTSTARASPQYVYIYIYTDIHVHNTTAVGCAHTSLESPGEAVKGNQGERLGQEGRGFEWV